MYLRVGPILALLSGWTASLPAQAPNLTVPVQIDTLANGLTLIVHEDHSVPIIAVNMWYHVGSGDEKPGRTGFAHLFEHLMFMGSEHAEYPAFDRLLEAAGGDNNGSTTEDRTNYYESGPRSALPLMLWLEADRMGWLLPTMTREKVDLQRDVVKNERRQSYENRPYGLADETMLRMLYPAAHPYSWPVIGSMTDLTAASVEDVMEFFRKYYAPNNAALVVAGDVAFADVKAQVERYFGEIPRGPPIERPEAPAFSLARDTAAVLEDKVQLPRVYARWHTVKGFTPDDAPLELLAYILAGEKNSRLTERLVYQEQLATNVVAYEDGKRLDGDFTIFATARPEHSLTEIKAAIDEELVRLAASGPTDRELRQAQNATEAGFLQSLERVSSKADQLNAYYYRTGQPDYFQRHLDRYRAVTVQDIQRVAQQYLGARRVLLSVVPEGHRELAATPKEATP